MHALLVSAAVVAVAEIGDKTQLLALLLAARFRAPLPIIAGILVSTLINHGLAAEVGILAAHWLGDGWLGGSAFKIIVGISFVLMAGWALIPDKADDETTSSKGRGAFMTTVIAFFLVEMGDKTQVATIALGATYHSLVWVTAGTTIGMMLANGPAVLLGGFSARKLPLGWVRGVAAAGFAILGLVSIADGVGILHSI